MAIESTRITDLGVIEARLARGIPLQGALDGLDRAQRAAGGEGLLHRAAHMGLPLLCDALAGAFPEMAEQRDHFGMTPLMHAAMSGSLGALHALAPRSDIEARAGRGATALLFAAKADKREAAEALLSLGADPAARDSHGSTALHCAARGRLESGLTELFLPLCDAMAKDANGFTAMDLLAASRHPMGQAVKAALERTMLTMDSAAPSGRSRGPLSL